MIKTKMCRPVFSLAVLLILWLPGVVFAQEGIITTIAGNGVRGYCGDGIPAVNSCFSEPWGLDVDAQGNVYVADRYNNRIRMIGTDGIIHTVAGTGASGFSGDGGPATQATFNATSSVVVNPEGGFYFTDHYGHRIRKVDADGIITTYAGTGVSGFCGDGGPATSACLKYPDGMALDIDGNLYVADGQNHRVRKIDTSGIITTVAGDGVFGHSGDGGPATDAHVTGPQGLAFDSQGNLYIASHITVLRMVDTNGIITTVGGIFGDRSFCGECSFLGDKIINHLPDNRNVRYPVLAIYHDVGSTSDAEELHVPIYAAQLAVCGEGIEIGQEAAPLHAKISVTLATLPECFPDLPLFILFNS